jgi:hypothetical protein
MAYQELSVHLSTKDNGGPNTMEAHRASYNSRKNAICPGVYAVVTNGICAANVVCN